LSRGERHRGLAGLAAVIASACLTFAMVREPDSFLGNHGEVCDNCILPPIGSACRRETRAGTAAWRRGRRMKLQPVMCGICKHDEVETENDRHRATKRMADNTMIARTAAEWVAQQLPATQVYHEPRTILSASCTRAFVSDAHLVGAALLELVDWPVHEATAREVPGLAGELCVDSIESAMPAARDGGHGLRLTALQASARVVKLEAAEAPAMGLPEHMVANFLHGEAENQSARSERVAAGKCIAGATATQPALEQQAYEASQYDTAVLPASDETEPASTQSDAASLARGPEPRLAGPSSIPRVRALRAMSAARGELESISGLG
jgi:hypothetical protein